MELWTGIGFEAPDNRLGMGGRVVGHVGGEFHAATGHFQVAPATLDLERRQVAPKRMVGRRQGRTDLNFEAMSACASQAEWLRARDDPIMEIVEPDVFRVRVVYQYGVDSRRASRGQKCFGG